jgi:Dolichyl-phosphate-mannose-protein mannosyltransferase
MFSSVKSNILSFGVAVTKHPDALLIPFFLVTTAWNVSTWEYFFFWDTTQLASEHAQFFYDTHFSNPLLPNGMDSGHPPVFGLYIALWWKLLDKTLIISHLAMLPFLLGIIWQAWRLGRTLLGDAFASVFVMALALNPVVAGQSVLVSPDVVLLFFFLMALNALFSQKISKWVLPIAILGLSMVSLRGMMVAAALFLYQLGLVFLNFNEKKSSDTPPQYIEGFSNKIKQILNLILPYLLGGSFALCFLLHHYFAKGWMGVNRTAGWAEAFQIVDFQGFIKNFATFAWRLLDFGHLFPVLIIGFWLIKIPKSFVLTRRILWLLLALILVLSPTLILHKGLLTHRYLLPIYATICLLAMRIISDLKNYKSQIALSLTIMVGLAMGNFWVYPQPIATGWDATLAHLPYYKLRRDMIQFIDNQQISYHKIGTSFPNQRSFEHTDLIFGKNETVFAPLNFSDNSYIFYSNVMNDFTKEELTILKNHWKTVKVLRGGKVEVILYKKP